MTNNSICKDTAFDCVIKIIADPWTLHIIRSLLKGEMRFNELSTKIGSITSATLSSKLKLLEEKKLVNRVSFNEIPPKVIYSLTETGQDLSKIISSLESFSLKHFGWCDK